jgi:hypothetical protein
MKKYFVISLLFISTVFYAQTMGINYQAVIYNPDPELLPGYSQINAPLVNTEVCLKFSIIDALSNVEYQETITATTDEFGMVNLIIGTGNPIGGYASIFEDIVWDSTTKRLQVDLDVSGKCSVFLEISNQPFTAVPFAFFAKRAENVTGVVAIANGGTGATTVSGAKTNLGLNNVDNTSDLNKPISTAAQAALNLKENTANKSTNTALGTSDVLFPTQNAVKTYVDSRINSGDTNLNSEIARAKAAESILTDNLSNEINRAMAAEKDLDDKKLDKILTKAETIETTSTNTLAIKGLENNVAASYELVSIDPVTGVLRKMSPSGVVVIKEVVYTANDDENKFITPKSITDINKVSVYRNGVRIGLTKLDSTHIQLETGVFCDDKDEIRIVQYD